MPVGPTPEWFPFRNQFLVTIAAAHAAKHGFGAVLLGGHRRLGVSVKQPGAGPTV